MNREVIQGRFRIHSWSKDDFLPDIYDLSPGDDVFMVGFPKGFHDRLHNLPVFRSAMVASSFRVPFEGLSLFLTDANLHPGMSGSPVITKPRETWVGQDGSVKVGTDPGRYYLVGIHSGTVRPEVSGGVDIGLGAAWYAELLAEIASQF